MSEAPASSLTEVARAAGEVARTSRASPRFAIVAFSLVAGLAIVLAFVYLVIKLPPTDPLSTTGDWLTRTQFREELGERDRRLAPATESALLQVRQAIDNLRAEFTAAKEADTSQRLAVVNALDRLDDRLAKATERIDRLYEAPAGK
jgi:hypothetical protein